MKYTLLLLVIGLAIQMVELKTIQRVAEVSKDCPGGTECPAGCCPIPNAFCCKDGQHCAVSEKYCPHENNYSLLISLATQKKDDCPGGTECPGGCCPIPNAFCCKDGDHCAVSEKYCPQVNNVAKLISLATHQQKDDCPGGTECPGGCCPIPNAFCCKDGDHCAISEKYCPHVNNVAKLISLATQKKDDCPGGTECPAGCCPIPNAFCCKDGDHCAVSEDNCPHSNIQAEIGSLFY